MSHFAQDWAGTLELRTHEKVVVLMLAHRHNGKTGQCNPSLERIMKDTGLSKASVCRALKALEEGRLIRRRRTYLMGLQRSTGYVLLFQNNVVVADCGTAVPGMASGSIAIDAVSDGDPLCLTQSATLSHTETQTRKKNKEVEQSADAEEIYTLYPRKDGKHAGIKAISKALESIDKATLMESVLRFAELCKKNCVEHKFIPMPATWFNGKRWEDEALCVSTQKKRVYSSFDDAEYLAHRAELEAQA